MKDLPLNLATALAIHITGGQANKSDLSQLSDFNRTYTGNLYVVLRRDPEFLVPSHEFLDARSSTRKNLLKNRSAGNIGIKYSDKALLIIEDAQRGFDVDYTASYLKGVRTYPEEFECIIGGYYKVVDEKEIEHPAGSGKFKIYTLRE